MVTESGPADGYAATDGLPRLIQTTTAHPENRGLSYRLILGDMAALQIDPPSAQFIADLGKDQTLGVGRKNKPFLAILLIQRIKGLRF